MNKISSINFGEIFLSPRLRKALRDNQQNPNELNYLKEAKPDCYMDLRFTKTNRNYLEATETDNILKNTLTERLWLDGKNLPLLSDVLTLYDTFQKSADNKNIRQINQIRRKPRRFPPLT